MSFNMQQMALVRDLGEVIRLHNEAVAKLQGFVKSNPGLVAPNLARMVEENLKENVSVLYRELNNLNKPPEARKRFVCRDCSNVFVVALPGGICDECRSKIYAPQRVVGVHPQMPEAEQETMTDLGTFLAGVDTDEIGADGDAAKTPAKGPHGQHQAPTVIDGE